MSEQFSVVDLTYLESIADGDDSIIKELIVIFLEQMPEFTDGFTDCFNNKAWKELAALAHKAKSSVISMGMNDLGNIELKNLELMAKWKRIDFLRDQQNLGEKELSELNNLSQNLNSYPNEKQEWIKANVSENLMLSIIEKFNSTCAIACNELKSVLEKK
ncbi:Hpt domain-containing protein [Alkaliflexus imshenetskii]|jgi:HPt (histidine-containing phosphotransfer) domain-containing protein|uniref:Hpt domain-containing protein n=1 Tax=Alkaliflexus imshenetskii TaxID=286730 RepID=UPI00047BE36F|nr:Hpt domain-containing protein [Alkaliflexus imshenetskii]